jgi:hypothetical protein
VDYHPEELLQVAARRQEGDRLQASDAGSEGTPGETQGREGSDWVVELQIQLSIERFVVLSLQQISKSQQIDQSFESTGLDSGIRSTTVNTRFEHTFMTIIS